MSVSNYSIEPVIPEANANAVVINPSRPSRRRRGLKLFVLSAAVICVGLAAGGLVYWQALKSSPQYSLALLIDAAARDDQASVNSLIDSDAAVDDFVPQVTAKAIELYGRGLPPETLARIENLATPLLPAVKDRAREELPRLIRQKTVKFRNVPFVALVVGADRYLDIKLDGDQATVKSKLPEHSFEIRMTRAGDRWKIVGVSDEKLAASIARKIGQEIVAIAKGGRNGAPQSASFKDFQDVLRRAQDIFK